QTVVPHPTPWMWAFFSQDERAMNVLLVHRGKSMMRAKTITGGFGVVLLLTLLLAPAAMAEDTAEQPATVTVEPGLLKQLDVDIRPSAELSVQELQVRIAKVTAALKRADLMHDAKKQ